MGSSPKWFATYSPKDLNDKEQVISKLYHAESIDIARIILANNLDLLSKNRTPWAILILKSLAVILTLPISLPAILIYSSVTRGTCNFFKPDSQILLDNVSMELSQGCK